MRKLLTIPLVAIAILASILGFAPEAGAVTYNDYFTTWYPCGPSNCYEVEVDHFTVTSPQGVPQWGYWQVIAHRWSLGFGAYQGVEMTTYGLEDFTCPTLDSDQYSWMITWRDSWNAQSQYSSGPCNVEQWSDWYADQAIEEVDMPYLGGNPSHYGYYWNGSGWSFLLASGNVQYGPYMPVDRTTYPNPIQRFY